MDIRLKKGNSEAEACDLLVVGVYEGKEATGGYDGIGTVLPAAVLATAEEEGFTGKRGRFFVVRPGEGVAAKRVCLVGLGNADKVDEEAVRIASAAALNLAREIKAEAIVFDLLGHGRVGGREAAKAMAEGLRLAAYRFERYKKHPKTLPAEVCILAPDAKVLRQAERGLADGELAAEGTAYARGLVNTPGEHMKPEDLVAAAKAIARGCPEIRAKVYDREDLKEMGAGGILGIAQGSDHEPFLVHLTYTPKKKSKKRVALVGKAITFDTGGYSLKPWQAMVGMKMDMAGAAAVLGTFSVIGRLAPDAEVHAVFAACENMVSGSAIRPGDVVATLNGKTIEIINTDAEGRVTLADALAFAVKLEPDAIVDLATLTGAAVVALGDDITALMSNDEALADALVDAACEAGEKLWELPLEDGYKKYLKSDVADYSNDGPRSAGAIVAGLLLQEFVGSIPWAHLDIAGPAFADRTANAYTPKGATGHGVRTLMRFLSRF